MASTDTREKFCYLGAPACFALEEALRPVVDAFADGCVGCFLVGSVLERPSWRDVDVRLMLTDEAFAAVFPAALSGRWEFDARWLVVNVAIAERLGRLTGLPIDFQMQPMTLTNQRHVGKRLAVGMRLSKVKEPV